MHDADVDVLIHCDMRKEEDHEVCSDVCCFSKREDEERVSEGFEIGSKTMTVQNSCRHGTIDREGSNVHG